ncbi:SAG family member [Eimeria necatrix]|uniref:SAG family member n=1 Tax=Eimeria necatrix TaxID=51315 RepID=U6MXE9_9EIME|nr:SAG family member [Eimeria necatrix]CDJ67169.1 SAG family member [Eimeria necatrix]
MRSLKLLFLAGSAVFFRDTQGAQASSGPTAPPGAAGAASIDCTTAMNSIRSDVGLAPLQLGTTEQAKLPLKAGDSPNVAFTGSVCTAARAGTMPPTTSTSLDGNFAISIQKGANGDCATAVKHWREGVNLFKGLPPPYAADSAVYKTTQAQSFVALFTPQQESKVDCAYFVCPETTDSGSKQEEIKALLCITSPKSLKEGTAPFEQKQWDKITAGLVGGASAAVPTFLVFAVTAVGVALF